MKKTILLLLIIFFGVSSFSQRRKVWTFGTPTDYKKQYSHIIDAAYVNDSTHLFIAGNLTDKASKSDKISGHKIYASGLSLPLIKNKEANPTGESDKILLTDFTIHPTSNLQYGAGTGIYYPNGVDNNAWLSIVGDIELNPRGSKIAFTGINTRSSLTGYHHPMTGMVDLDLNLQWCYAYEITSAKYAGIDVEFNEDDTTLQPSKYYVSIYNILGMIVYENEFDAIKGITPVKMKFNVKPSVYMIKVSNGVNADTKKVINYHLR